MNSKLSREYLLLLTKILVILLLLIQPGKKKSDVNFDVDASGGKMESLSVTVFILVLTGGMKLPAIEFSNNTISQIRRIPAEFPYCTILIDQFTERSIPPLSNNSGLL